MMRFFLFILLMLIPLNAAARPVVADLAIRSIEIDHNFKGIDILLFGAREDVGDVVVVVRGPERGYTVHKKGRVGGIWVNRKAMEFEPTSSFYAVASSRPLSVINNSQLLDALGVGVEHVPVHPLYAETDAVKVKEFREALVRQKQRVNLYPKDTAEVSFWGDTLFRTVIEFPKNIIGGMYTAEVYLFSDGQLVGVQSTPLEVRKIGFEAFMYDFAHRYSTLYGVVAVGLALLAGWIASVVFRKM
jgi:uncharacterized protein (TIGR02186 family)